jgi:transcriptional regulator with PAS, ATPase and Fis domain
VRDTRVPVLITGETGTDKELVTRALHDTSARRDALFVAQNCAALPAPLLESELFGHVRGAFTGADRDKKGLFEVAHGGTIFLDELAELPLALQAKLLRVVQEGEVSPVGSPRPRPVDVRIVSATHRDLVAMVAEGTFREDLYYRLAVFPIQVPALRARPEDIAPLARHLLTRYAAELGRDVIDFTPEALRALVAHDWRGNVRALQNELQRALIRHEGGPMLTLDDLSAALTGPAVGETPPGSDLRVQLAEAERAILARVLGDHGGNKTRAAAALGITREGLHKKLARFGLS